MDTQGVRDNQAAVREETRENIHERGAESGHGASCLVATAFAEKQPATSIVEAIRALLSSKPLGAGAFHVYGRKHGFQFNQVSTGILNAYMIHIDRCQFHGCIQVFCRSD